MDSSKECNVEFIDDYKKYFFDYVLNPEQITSKVDEALKDIICEEALPEEYTKYLSLKEKQLINFVHILI